MLKEQLSAFSQAGQVANLQAESSLCLAQEPS
jgi:hypothetical protein